MKVEKVKEKEKHPSPLTLARGHKTHQSMCLTCLNFYEEPHDFPTCPIPVRNTDTNIFILNRDLLSSCSLKKKHEWIS